MAGVILAGELADYRKQIDALNDRTHILLAGLGQAQLFWRHAPESWSIGECLLHINLSNRGMLPEIDRAIERARARGLTAEGPFRHGWPGSWLLGVLEPPVRRKVKTAPWAVPQQREGTSASIEVELRAVHGEVIERLGRAQGLHLGKTKVTSPFMPLLRYTLGQAFAIIAVHGRRHLWQAEQVRANQGFPGA